MDRDLALQLITKLNDIKTALTGIKSACDTIAVNTTPETTPEETVASTRTAKK